MAASQPDSSLEIAAVEIINEPNQPDSEFVKAVVQAEKTEEIRQATPFERLRLLVMHGDSQMAEFWSALSLLVWGLWVGNPFLDVLEHTPNFTVLALIDPHESLWGGIVFLLGCAQMSGLLFKHPRWRRTGTFIASLGWWGLVLAVLVSNWQAPVIAIYGTLLIGAVWANLRLALDSRKVVPRVP